MSRPTLVPDALLENRYELVLLYYVRNGNPNGDPDADVYGNITASASVI